MQQRNYFAQMQWEIRLQVENFCYEIFKRRSKVHQKNMSEIHLKFGPMKSISQKLQANRRFCLQIYQKQLPFTIYCWVHSNSKERYPTSLDKISILTGKPLVIINQSFCCELNSSRTYFLQNISYLSLRL